MILVDTSVWIDHLRAKDDQLSQLLFDCKVIIHPFVVGELALGNLQQREPILGWLQRLPQASMASEPEVLHLINNQSLFGSGIGYIDAHLLAAVLLTPASKLWTRDKRLHAAGARLNLVTHMTH